LSHGLTLVFDRATAAIVGGMGTCDFYLAFHDDLSAFFFSRRAGAAAAASAGW